MTSHPVSPEGGEGAKVERWTVGYSDGSGPEYVLDGSGEAVCKVRWGCSCCERRVETDPLTEVESARLRLIATAPDANAVCAALVHYDRWSFRPTPENAVALRRALNAIGTDGPLGASLGPIIEAARQAVLKAGGSW